MAHPALLLVLLLSSPAISSSKRIQPKFPAIFYFGDSVLDTGNNNRLPTVALANHVPYGRDFPGKKPTGRFSNGRLVPDLLNQRLQLKEFSPPYLDSKLSNNDIMTGVNFASAGSGFDDQTSQLANSLPMFEAVKQVNLFKDYLLRLRNIVGDKGRFQDHCQLPDFYQLRNQRFLTLLPFVKEEKDGHWCIPRYCYPDGTSSCQGKNRHLFPLFELPSLF